jgi:DGQHR domain-containing protein
MNEILKSIFTSDQRALAATIGAKSDSLEEKIVQLFTNLQDPLLSGDDVHSLLAVQSSAEEVTTALKALVEKKTLEVSDQTLRALDPDGISLYRLQNVPFTRLKLIAVESALNDGTTRFQLTCDGRIVRSIARIDRLDALAGDGNQREEIHKHVKDIAKGIMSGTQIPNSVLLVMLKNQVVEAKDGEADDGIPESNIVIRPASDWISVGVPHDAEVPIQKFRSVAIDIPFRRAAFDEEKSTLLVDGQQRTAALSLVDIDIVPQFSLSVNAVQADAEEAKRVFRVANSTVKITADFSRALLSTMSDTPVYLRQERDQALAVKKIALEMKESPFFGMAQHPGVKPTPRPPIAYNSLFQVVKVFADSPLPFADAEILADTVSRAFAIVKKTWPDEWGRKPTDSKLMHGVGLRSLSSLVVYKLEGLLPAFNGDLADTALWDSIEASLKRLSEIIVWSNTAALNAQKAVQKLYRDEIGDYQNTSQDIERCTKLLREKSLAADTEAAGKAKKGAK